MKDLKVIKNIDIIIQIYIAFAMYIINPSKQSAIEYLIANLKNAERCITKKNAKLLITFKILNNNYYEINEIETFLNPNNINREDFFNNIVNSTLNRELDIKYIINQ